MIGTDTPTQPKTKGSLLKRFLTTIVGVSYFLCLCFWGRLPFCAGVTIVAALGIHELVHAYHRRSSQDAGGEKAGSAGQGDWVNPTAAWIGIVFPAAAFVVSGTGGRTALAYGGALVLLVCAFALLLLRAAYTGRALGRKRVHYGLFGCMYVGLLFSSFVLLRAMPGRIAVGPFHQADRGAWLMLFAAMCVWATDTFAYFVGRTWGRRPLAPSLSPGKTVEGAIGGMLGATAVGIGFGLWIHLPWQSGLIVGLIAGLAGQIGDLFESALKREIGIKDFGALMPGHGGMLDRADSLLFAIPLAYLYLSLTNGP